jgi:hypothetical protein
VVGNCEIAKLQDRRLVLIKQILRLRLRISAEGFRSAAPRLRLQTASILDFLAIPAILAVFSYLFWLLGV